LQENLGKEADEGNPAGKIWKRGVSPEKERSPPGIFPFQGGEIRRGRSPEMGSRGHEWEA